MNAIGCTCEPTAVKLSRRERRLLGRDHIVVHETGCDLATAQRRTAAATWLALRQRDGGYRPAADIPEPTTPPSAPSGLSKAVRK